VIVTYFLSAAVPGLSRMSRTPCIEGVGSEGVKKVITKQWAYKVKYRQLIHENNDQCRRVKCVM